MTRPPLHIQSKGQGPDLVLLHGWAMHSGYFKLIAEKLAQNFRIHVVDLPGHGHSRLYPENYSIQNLAKEILNTVIPVISEKAIWLGWSLGGCIATWLAEHAGKHVEALVLVASNPRFVQQADWPFGIADTVLQDFADSLAKDYEKTLLRFLSLQIRGADNARELLRQLRIQMRETPVPDTAVLNGGLEILRHFDSRTLLPQLEQRVLLISGQKDTLVPVKALQTIAEKSINTRLSVWPNAGHAPFLTNPDKFTKEVKVFADDIMS